MCFGVRLRRARGGYESGISVFLITVTRSSLNRPCILQFVTSSVLAIKDNINCHPTSARGRVLSNHTRMSMIQSWRWAKKAKKKQTNKQHITLAENSSCVKILFLLPPILSSRSSPKILKRHFLPKRILVNALQKKQKEGRKSERRGRRESEISKFCFLPIPELRIF